MSTFYHFLPAGIFSEADVLSAPKNPTLINPPWHHPTDQNFLHFKLAIAGQTPSSQRPCRRTHSTIATIQPRRDIQSNAVTMTPSLPLIYVVRCEQQNKKALLDIRAISFTGRGLQNNLKPVFVSPSRRLYGTQPVQMPPAGQPAASMASPEIEDTQLSPLRESSGKSPCPPANWANVHLLKFLAPETPLISLIATHGLLKSSRLIC